MNIQLVNSLIEVVFHLEPEDRELFQSQLHTKIESQKNQPRLKNAEDFRKMLEQLPKTDVDLPLEAISRENIYSDDQEYDRITPLIGTLHIGTTDLAENCDLYLAEVLEQELSFDK